MHTRLRQYEELNAPPFLQHRFRTPTCMHAPSSGMKGDMEVAIRKGKKLEYIEDILGYYPNINAMMKSCGLTEFVTIDEKRVELPLQNA